MGDDSAKSRFVVISKRGFTGKNTATDFFTDAALDVYREVTNVLIRHAKLDRNHKHVVARQICFLKRANFLDDATLKQTNNFSTVIKIAGETVELP